MSVCLSPAWDGWLEVVPARSRCAKESRPKVLPAHGSRQRPALCPGCPLLAKAGQCQARALLNGPWVGTWRVQQGACHSGAESRVISRGAEEEKLAFPPERESVTMMV